MYNSKNSVAFLLILLFQFVLVGDYLAPLLWGRLEVSGLSCTCPDETVVRGHLYLRMITPDSLKQYDLSYSEIFVTERPVESPDWTGGWNYVIWGEVIGKARVSEGSSWHPVFRVDKWYQLNPILAVLSKVILVVEIIMIIMFLIATFKTNNNPIILDAND